MKLIREIVRALHDETGDAEAPRRGDELGPVVGVECLLRPRARERKSRLEERGFRFRGADLERERPQGNEAGKVRQDGEDAVPVKGVRVRDEDRRDVRCELPESSTGRRNGREDVPPRGDPDGVGQARQGCGALDRAKEFRRREVTEVELPFERTEDVRREGFRRDARRRREPAQGDSVLETDEDIPEVDEESAQRFGLSQGRASWPVRR